MSKDTITVELPIKAEDGGYVRVFGIRWAREYWREFAADPSIALSEQTRVLAPAVVAWIERDEWKPLGVPEVGRTIKATKRNGKTEAFQTSEVKALRRVVHVYDSEGDHFAIPLTVERAEWERDYDIIAWEYVDEPAQPTISAEQVEAAARDLYEEEANDSGGFDSWPKWDSHDNATRQIWRFRVRSAFRAAGLTVAGGSDD